MQTNRTTSNRENQSVNVFDLLMYLVSKWKWFLLSVLLFGSIAWLHYARSGLVYFRSATVIIKDPSNKTSSAAGLDRYDNIINKVNVANEVLQFRTKTLMRQVVSRLHADMSYLVEDGLRDKELYTKCPFSVTLPDATAESFTKMTVKLISTKEAEVVWGGKKSNLPLGKMMKTSNGRIRINATDFLSQKWIGTTITVVKHPVSAMAGYYQGQLGIRQEEEESSILTLSLKDSSPERADDVLNMLITIYNEDAINDKNQVAVNTAEFINERLIIIEKELGGVESDLESFKVSNQLVDIGSQAARYMGESQRYNADAVELETQLRLAQYIKDYLTDPSKDGDLIPANTGIQDMNLESQINQYNSMRLRRDKLIVDSSDQNPVVEELNNSLRSMKQSIIRAVDNVIVNINVRRKDAKSYEHQAQARVSSIPTKERKMLSIERQQKIKESLYLFLLNRREENALSQAMADNNARIIDGTDGSNSPIAPSRNRILLLGLLLGLAIPAVWFLLIMFLDTRIHTRKDVQGAVSVPFLGEVPLAKKRRGDNSEEESEATHLVGEALRIIRTNMEFMSRNGRPAQVITFTSFNEGAGKTFIASNLAKTYLSAKKRVLLIDLDIRKGTLSEQFDHHHKGMTHFLSDYSLTIDDVIQHGDGESIPDVIVAGPVAPNPAELLMDSRLDNLIESLREHYDYIIIDNVPVGIIADASIANRIADLTLFVVRAGRLDRRQLPDIENLYQEKKLKNMALILNGINQRHFGYGRYGYGYGYGYGKKGYGYGYGKRAKKK